jgi:hypothetical protein
VAGAWIVGGIGFGVVSVIARASYVGNYQKRELTSGEAMSAFFLPFAWVFFPGDPIRGSTATSLARGVTSYPGDPIKSRGVTSHPGDPVKSRGVTSHPGDPVK